MKILLKIFLPLFVIISTSSPLSAMESDKEKANKISNLNELLENLNLVEQEAAGPVDQLAALFSTIQTRMHQEWPDKEIKRIQNYPPKKIKILYLTIEKTCNKALTDTPTELAHKTLKVADDLISFLLRTNVDFLAECHPILKEIIDFDRKQKKHSLTLKPIDSIMKMLLDFFKTKENCSCFLDCFSDSIKSKERRAELKQLLAKNLIAECALRNKDFVTPIKDALDSLTDEVPAPPSSPDNMDITWLTKQEKYIKNFHKYFDPYNDNEEKSIETSITHLCTIGLAIIKFLPTIILNDKQLHKDLLNAIKECKK